MKSIKLFVAAFTATLALTFTSCGNKTTAEKEANPVADSLSAANSNMKGELSEKEAQLQDFVSAFNDIQTDLNEIKEKEKVLSNLKPGGDVKSREEQIKADIQSLYDLLNKNKSRVASLSKKLKAANSKIDGLEKMVANLEAQVADKDNVIAELKTTIEKLNIDLSNLNTNYQNSEAESAGKTEQLNTAWYVIGTGKELKTYGITEKEGGFIGLGKTTEVKPDFNKDKFTKIDITQTTSIPIGAKKAKVLTTHPSSSYKLVGEKPVQKIEITDPTAFWGSSKYLVIVTE